MIIMKLVHVDIAVKEFSPGRQCCMTAWLCTDCCITPGDMSQDLHSTRADNHTSLEHPVP
jgi:hypothetical protein